MRSMVSPMVLLLALSLVAAAPATGLGADVAKIGVLDFQKIFDTSEAGKKAQKEINAQGSRMEKDLKAKGEQVEQLKKQLEREAMVMSKEKREEKQREFRIQVNDLKSLKRKYEKELQQLQKRLIDNIRKDVLDIVQELGRKEGYLLIIEQIGVVYAPDSVDITDRIIRIYNERYAAGKTKASSS